MWCELKLMESITELYLHTLSRQHSVHHGNYGVWGKSELINYAQMHRLWQPFMCVCERSVFFARRKWSCRRSDGCLCECWCFKQNPPRWILISAKAQPCGSVKVEMQNIFANYLCLWKCEVWVSESVCGMHVYPSPSIRVNH